MPFRLDGYLVVRGVLVLAGCSTVDSLRGEGFHDNSMSDAIRETQPAAKKPQEFWSFSNKAREIEADFPDS